jgi:peroxiredoxin
VNTLVCFTGRRLDRPLDLLGSVASVLDSGERPLSVLLVLPLGQFERTRAELEAELGGFRDRGGAGLLITEDYGGEWSRTFGVSDAPAAHFINARGEFAWRHEGALEQDRLASVLRDHLLPAAPPRTRLIRLAVRAGEQAPNAMLVDSRGHQTTLRRMRGKRVLLNFWQSWSAPCIRELQRLQRLHEAGSEWIVIAVSGDANEAALEEVRRAHGLTFALVHDGERAIASLYTIRCWPTTVSITEEGLVERIWFGRVPERHAELPHE